MLCLSARLQQHYGFYFHLFFFFLLATQGPPRMWPFCMLWLLLLAWCFLWRSGCWNAPFRERQMEPQSRIFGHYFSLSLSLFFLPLALHSNISWAPTSSRPKRATTSGTRQTEMKNGSCPQHTVLCDLMQMLSLIHSKIWGNWVRWFLEKLSVFIPIIFKSCFSGWPANYSSLDNFSLQFNMLMVLPVLLINCYILQEYETI